MLSLIKENFDHETNFCVSKYLRASRLLTAYCLRLLTLFQTYLPCYKRTQGILITAHHGFVPSNLRYLRNYVQEHFSQRLCNAFFVLYLSFAMFSTARIECTGTTATNTSRSSNAPCAATRTWASRRYASTCCKCLTDWIKQVFV